MKYSFEKIKAGYYNIVVDGKVIGSVDKSGSKWVISGENGERIGMWDTSRKAATERFIEVIETKAKNIATHEAKKAAEKTVKFLGHDVVSITEEEAKALDLMMGNTYDLKEFDAFKGLKEGYYKVNGVIFFIERTGYMDILVLPLFKQTFIDDYIESKWDGEAAEAKAAKTVEYDADDEINLGDGEKPRRVNLPDWFGRKVYVQEDGDYNDSDILEVYVNGEHAVDMFRLRKGDGTFFYSCYDGINPFGEYPSPKRAIKAFLMATYPEQEEYYEPKCSACGDGGCIHCEPSRFIRY